MVKRLVFGRRRNWLAWSVFGIGAGLFLGLLLVAYPCQTAAQHDPAQLVSVVVEFDEPSVVEHLTEGLAAAAVDPTLRQAAARRQLERIEAEQATMATKLSRLGATELYRMQRLYNGIAVRVAPEDLPTLTALPGVRGVRPIIPKTPAHAVSVPFIGAPALWTGSSIPGVTGEGITIAVIDTGIDYLHRNFGGPGAGYENNDETRSDDVPGFPGVKVVGGYDFSGDDYNANPDDATYQPIPRPDPDPYDCYGHGTHVAGTAAGLGVTADGATYAGPYDTAVDLASMRIAPGVAPGATLYALKVFGCTGATELTDLALEWAVDPDGDGDFSDRVDVVNLSLGSAFGTRYDTTALAADRASELGVIVVASAGNSGDHYYAVGSPGVADRAVSVAAVGLQRRDQGVMPEITYFSSRGPRSSDNALKPDIAAPGQAIASALAGTGSFGVALSGTSMAAPHAAGGLALLRQLYPDWPAEDLKSLVMSTTRFPAGTGGPDDEAPYGPTRTGAGVLDLAAAAASPLFVRAADEPGRVAVSFGRLEVRDVISTSRQINIVNRGVQPIRLTAQVDGVSPLPGAAVSLNATDVMTLGAGESATVTLQLAADAAQLRHTQDTSTLTPAGTARHWIGEIAGAVIFTATSADGTQLPPLRLPYYAAVRPVATLTTTDTLTMDANGHGEIVLTGAGLDGEDPPEAYVSLVSLFELSHASGDLAPVTQEEGVDLQEYGDLQQIGVTANLTKSRPISETMLYFAVAMRGPWASPNQVEASVFLDVNRDGNDDYRLFNSNSVAYLNDKGTSDIFVTALEDLVTGQRKIVTPLNVLPADEAETRLFDGRVMILAVPAQDVALGYERSEFFYRVETRIRETNEVYDATPRLAYDIMRPGIRLEGGSGLPVMRRAQADDSFRLVLDAGAAGANGSQGVLFISHQNAIDLQIKPMAWDLGLPPRFYLPIFRAANAE